MVSIKDHYIHYSHLIYLMLINFIRTSYHLVKLFTFSCRVTESSDGAFGLILGAVSLLNVVYALFCQKGALRHDIQKYRERELPYL